MGDVAVNVKDENHADINEKGGVIQQADSGKGGNLNVYHRDFPKISSNFDKQPPPPLLFTTKMLDSPNLMRIIQLKHKVILRKSRSQNHPLTPYFKLYQLDRGKSVKPKVLI